MTASLQTQGFGRAGRLLRRLADIGGKRSMGRALAAGARVARKAIRTAAPKRTSGELKRVRASRIARGPGGSIRVPRASVRVRRPGFLKRNIRMKRIRPRGGVLKYRVAPVATAFYARFLETGTQHQRRKAFMFPAVARSLKAIQRAVEDKAAAELGARVREG